MPEKPDNGWVKYRYLTVGAQARYYCNSGYTLVGSQSRTCHSDGNWQPQIPICRRKVYAHTHAHMRALTHSHTHTHTLTTYTYTLYVSN